jgi:hypothetical protein
MTMTDQNRQALDTLAALGIATHRLDQIRDAARLHRQQLIGTSELYAVIEADGPAVQAPATDQTALRDRIAAAIWERQNPGRRWADCEHPWGADAEADADAVLAVLPPPADRAAVPSEVVRKTLRRWAYAAGHIESELDDAVNRMYVLVAQDVLCRMADETQPTETVPCMRPEPHPAHSHSGLRKGVAVHGRCPGEPTAAWQDGAQP